MCSKWTGRCVVAVAAAALFSAIPAYAQKGAPGSTGGGATTGGTLGSPTRGGTLGTGTIPGNGPTGIGGGFNRTIFLSGKVVLDDGSQPNPNIRIERVCGANARLEGHTDGKGRFSIQLGQDLGVDTDASDSNPNTRTNGAWNSSSGLSNSGLSSNNQNSALWNCELRAAYPGYRSDVVELGSRRALDDPDLGTIILHRLANVQGSTISLTTALAPKHAQKDYEKGVQLAEKGDYAGAEKRLSAATDTYPKYAIAWFALGQVEYRQNKTEEARKSWQAAIAADRKYVSPCEALAALELKQQRFQEAADYSQQAIELNPVEFPSVFWYNALANYNLKKSAPAEKSDRELLKLDTAHRYPQAENLLAHLLAEKGEYSEAAEHLRTYLRLAPEAKDAGVAREDLKKLEQASAQAKK